MTVTRGESMFQSRQCLARLGKLRIDRERTFVPGPGFRFQTDTRAIVADPERRPCIAIENVRFERFATDGCERRKMIAREKCLVFSDHLVQGNGFRFWFNGDQDSALIWPVILVEAVVVVSDGTDDAKNSVRIRLRQRLQ